MSAPTKLNTGNDRPVTSVLVKSADNASTEREQLNRILKDLNTRLSAVESRVTDLEDE
jgi:hypothetical protein